MNKSALLRKLFKKKNSLIRIAGAHNGLTAKLVEKNGFDGIWASGFEISASFAVPDASILSFSEFFSSAALMNAVVSIPVIADCDTGFGDAANIEEVIRKYEGAGIAAISIEDKRFPKLNSFAEGEQKLAPLSEFTAKVRAAKKAQITKDFMIFARIEALIAGLGIKEALKRARAYVKAGADAIIIHSRSKTPDEIASFAKQWKSSTPLIVIPTSYSSITADQLKKMGIKMAIYANYGIRASIKAADEGLAEIMKKGTAKGLEDKVASMKEIFKLQGLQ